MLGGVGSNVDSVDERDLPVATNYITILNSLPGVTIRGASKWLNAVSLDVKSVQTLSEIAELPFVDHIQPVRHTSQRRSRFVSQPHGTQQPLGRDTTLNYGYSYAQLSQIGVPLLHAQGYNGSGILILILDTGFDTNHPALANLRVVQQHDFLHNDSNTNHEKGDDPAQIEHGTAVLSVLGGSVGGTMYGPAYGAEFLLAMTEEVAGEDHKYEEDAYVYALEWGEALGADISTASVGYLADSPAELNGTMGITTVAVNTAVERGLVVINAAGNEADFGVSMPNDAFLVVSVGAVTLPSTSGSGGGAIAGFSSRGPTMDGRIKPEVCAGGVDVYAAMATIKNGATRYSYGLISGTSVAAPLVAGAAALLLQAHPDWSNIQLRAALMATASRADQPDNTYGWGIVNASAANNYSVPSTCPTQTCSGRGTCIAGQLACVCSSDYYEFDCSLTKLACSEWCNPKHGTCETGKACVCSEDYAGIYCSYKVPSSQHSVHVAAGSLFVLVLIAMF